MFTSIIRTIIGTKFQINPLAISLFYGSGPKSPSVAGEISEAFGLDISARQSILSMTKTNCSFNMKVLVLFLCFSCLTAAYLIKLLKEGKLRQSDVTLTLLEDMLLSDCPTRNLGLHYVKFKYLKVIQNVPGDPKKVLLFRHA